LETLAEMLKEYDIDVIDPLAGDAVRHDLHQVIGHDMESNQEAGSIVRVEECGFMRRRDRNAIAKAKVVTAS
jgi:molecular chaperone GrpE (heat shock protein)